MRVLRYLLPFLSLLLAPLHVQAQVSDLAAQFEHESLRKIKSDIDFSVEFTSLILRVGQQIDDDLKEKGSVQDARVDDFLYATDSKIESILKEKVSYYAQFYEENIDIPKGKIEKFKYYLSRVNWSELIPIIKKSFVGLSGFFKRKGVGIVVAMFVGQVMEYTVYFSLYTLGLSKLIPLSMAIPYGTLLTLVPSVEERFRIKRKMTALLGGRDQYRAYQLQMKKSLEKLKMKKQDQILFPLRLPDTPEDAVDALVLSKKSWWHSLLTRLGLNPKDLSYPSLNLYMLMNQIEDEYIIWVKDSDALTHPMKTALIVEHLMTTLDGKDRLKFQKRFANNFTQVKRSHYWRALEDWTLEIMQAKNVDDIRRQMASIPYGVTPQQILELWENIILPHYSTSLDFKYTSYRRLKEKITLLKGLSYQENQPNWNKIFFEKFDEILLDSLKIALPPCKHPEGKALKILLAQ